MKESTLLREEYWEQEGYTTGRFCFRNTAGGPEWQLPVSGGPGPAYMQHRLSKSFRG